MQTSHLSSLAALRSISVGSSSSQSKTEQFFAKASQVPVNAHDSSISPRVGILFENFRFVEFQFLLKTRDLAWLSQAYPFSQSSAG